MKTFFKVNKNGHVFDIENYDDETKYVITAPPSWIIRNGIAVIFFVLLTILLISYFVKYPDVLKSEITITSQNTPAEIKARASGRITLFCKEGEFVKMQTILGFISNASNYNDILTLKAFLAEQGKKIESLKLTDINVPRKLVLGEVERSFVTFSTSFEEYIHFKNHHSHLQSISDIKRQIEILQELNRQINIQRTLNVEEVVLAKRRMSTDSVLFKQNVISQLDFEKSVSSYLPYKKQLEQIDQTLINNKLRKAELEGRISQLIHSSHESETRLINTILSSYNNLISDLKIWEDRYLLVAPIDGTVAFFEFWNNNQNVDMAETILTVVPERSKMFGLMLMPIVGSGKAKIGQTVNVRLHNYPYNEYGVLKGEISKISPVPQNDMYAVTVTFSNGLVTTQGITLEFREQMKGSAEIITKDLRLIERFFYQINKFIRA